MIIIEFYEEKNLITFKSPCFEEYYFEKKWEAQNIDKSNPWVNQLVEVLVG